MKVLIKTMMLTIKYDVIHKRCRFSKIVYYKVDALYANSGTYFKRLAVMSIPYKYYHCVAYAKAAIAISENLQSLLIR